MEAKAGEKTADGGEERLTGGFTKTQRLPRIFLQLHLPHLPLSLLFVLQQVISKTGYISVIRGGFKAVGQREGDSFRVEIQIVWPIRAFLSAFRFFLINF